MDDKNSELLTLSREITETYFSTLRFKLKNDCVCRLISNFFSCSTFVSILLYESGSDTLVNYGHYLNAENCEFHSDENSPQMEFLLRNISLFEYLVHRYKTTSMERCSYEDYKNQIYFFSEYLFTRDNIKIPIDSFIFNEIKKDFFTAEDEPLNSELYLLYKKYKNIIANEDSYNVYENQSPSGVYFNKLIKRELQGSDKKRYFICSRDVPWKNKILVKLYDERLHVKIEPNSYYLAISLQTDSRYIGIIRVLYHIKDDWKDEVSKKTTQEIFESVVGAEDEKHLLELAKIIAIHIGETYSKNEFKQISFKKIQDEYPFRGVTVDSENAGLKTFKEFSEALRKTINCNAVLIRVEDKNNEFPFIKGWTSKLNEYVAEINSNDNFYKNLSLLNKIFELNKSKKNTANPISLIGVKVYINQERASKFEYYYSTSDEIINFTKEPGYINATLAALIKKIFPRDLLIKLVKLDIEQVVIIKIPFVENGYITFSNTNYRPFTKNDIETVYPHITHLGYQLKMSFNKEQEEQAILLNRLHHDLSKLISRAVSKAKSMNAVIETLVENGFPENEMQRIKETLKREEENIPLQFENYLRHIEFLFDFFNIKKQIESKEFKLSENVPKDFAKLIGDLINVYRNYARSDYNLELIKDWRDEDCLDRVTLDQRVLGAIFFELLTNALKYSYTKKERLSSIRNYSQNYGDKSDGHIRVKCFSSSAYYGFSIVNWGKGIPKQYEKKIFEYKFRVAQVQPFDEEREIEGAGIGLSNVKEFVEMLRGSIKIKSNKDKTTATVLWKK